MQCTNTMLHFDLGGGLRTNPGGGSVLGLPIVVDSEGAEFVYYKGVLTHVDQVPLPRLHREEIGSGVPKQKRVPVTALTPQVPTTPDGQPLPAFAQVQRMGDMIHPDSPILKKE